MNNITKISKFHRFECLMSWSKIVSYRSQDILKRNFGLSLTPEIKESFELLTHEIKESKLKKHCSSIEPSLNYDKTNRLLNLAQVPMIVQVQVRNFSEDGRIAREYDDAANETLISLTDMFEDIAETLDVDPDFDIAFENGVLTVTIDKSWGTYVINKQSPNRQIWLSSPISGPKRYDLKDNKWVYSHDGNTLHELLTREISEALKHELNFTKCAYGG